MNDPRFPNAAEVRAGMRRLDQANERVRELQQAQIAQSIFGARICDRVRVAQALVEALGLLHEAVGMYLLLMGLGEGEDFPGVVEEA